MMLQEMINESYDIEYHEAGEPNEPVLKIIDKDKNQEHRFYPEDLKIIMKFLDRLKIFNMIKE